MQDTEVELADISAATRLPRCLRPLARRFLAFLAATRPGESATVRWGRRRRREIVGAHL